MGLIQLLTVGRSINEPKSGPNGYKLKGGMLPKFAPVGRGISLSPFCARPLPELPVAAQAELIFETKPEAPKRISTKTNIFSQAAREMAATQTEPVAEVEKAAVLITKTAEASAELLAPLQPLAVEAKAATEKLKLKRRWSLREIFYVRQEKKMQKQQQCSWTLDKVTVIRNELVDSDIEIVLGRSAPEKLPLTPSGDAASKWKMSSPHWTRWVTRWVRVERTAK